MKGFKTLLFNGGLIAAASVLHYIVGTDLTSVIGPTGSLIVVGAANIILRFLTTTPVGVK